MAKIVVTYHKDCIDGTAAAAVLLKKFPEALLFPLSHSYTAADLAPALAEVTQDTLCYTMDCILGVKEFLGKGAQVTTIDHHIGVKEESDARAAQEPRYTYVFDNDKSGSSLAWRHFFGSEPIPQAILYIEDADLWNLKLGENTKYVNSYLSMFRNDPKAMLMLITGDLAGIVEKGRVLAQYADQEIARLVELPPLTLAIGEHRVPAFNITVYESASGNRLSEKYGSAVALFTIKGSQVKLSFRSKDGQAPSALELAAILGGGGHKNASGAGIPLAAFLTMLSDLRQEA